MMIERNGAFRAHVIPNALREGAIKKISDQHLQHHPYIGDSYWSK
jgi:hypothetical protein